MEKTTRILQQSALRARVLAGDESAWRALYDESFEALFAYALRGCDRDRARAEDLVQECWMTAVRRIREFDPTRGSFFGWLRGICRNTLRNERRRWQKQESHALGSRDVEAAGSDESGRVEARELGEHIAMTLAELPETYRDVLRAKYEDRLSVAEIAGRLGRSLKSVESLLTRARTAFRGAYQRLRAENRTVRCESRNRP